MMNIYYLFLLVMVSIGSSYITTQMPRLKRVFKRLLQRSKPKSRTVVNNDLSTLITRIESLETRMAKRSANQRTFIREEVRNYLEKLRK